MRQFCRATLKDSTFLPQKCQLQALCRKNENDLLVIATKKGQNLFILVTFIFVLLSRAKVKYYKNGTSLPFQLFVIAKIDGILFSWNETY